MKNIKFTVSFLIIVFIFGYCTLRTTNQEKQTCIDQGGEFFENLESASVCVVLKE